MRDRFNETIAENKVKKENPDIAQAVSSLSSFKDFSGPLKKVYSSEPFNFYGSEIRIQASETQRIQKKAEIIKLRQSIEEMRGDMIFYKQQYENVRDLNEMCVNNELAAREEIEKLKIEIHVIKIKYEDKIENIKGDLNSQTDAVKFELEKIHGIHQTYKEFTEMEHLI